MGKPHAIVIPYPAQGHVLPMLELSQWLVRHGNIKVTFVNTEYNHERVVKSLSGSVDSIRQVVTMVSIRDGVEPWEDRNDLGKLTEAIYKVMPVELGALIEKLNGDGDHVTGVIADGQFGWAYEVAAKAGIKKAGFWPASAAAVASLLNIPKLISDGIIDGSGKILKHQMVQFAPNMPPMHSTNFLWATVGDPTSQRIIFELLNGVHSSIQLADRLICNSSYELEPGAFSLYPDILPVGPLLASNRLGKPAGCFWPEDSACLAWLDRQPANSVVYVAFGSFTIFDRKQFDELALGLELTNSPFLWVVRPDATAHYNEDGDYPEGFMDRVKDRGLVVRWAPQQQVLSHPSVACFVSHCGWNSTVEGVSNGVPILCWPYFADQFLNETYVCGEWRIGLGLRKDERGIIGRGEIKGKLEKLISDKDYRERALDLQAKTMDCFRGGNSNKIFNDFIEWIKDE
ncbi:hypothetical protein OROHE_026516 [Orobanche hederae]